MYRGHASRRRESLASEAHRCLVFGSLNMDLHAVTGQKWPRAGHIVTLTHGHFVANPGGKGANEAVALARLGIDVRLVGRVGDDQMGELALAALQDDVGTGGITKAPNSTTAITVLMQAKTHQVKLTCEGANDEIDGRELGEALRHLPPPPPAARASAAESAPLPLPPLRVPSRERSGSALEEESVGRGGPTNEEAAAAEAAAEERSAALDASLAAALAKPPAAPTDRKPVEVVLMQLEVAAEPMLALVHVARSAASRWR